MNKRYLASVFLGQGLEKIRLHKRDVRADRCDAVFLGRRWADREVFRIDAVFHCACENRYYVGA